MKNPLTPSGIEPATFRFVAQHLNHCATAVPHGNNNNNNNKQIFFFEKKRVRDEFSETLCANHFPAQLMAFS